MPITEVISDDFATYPQWIQNIATELSDPYFRGCGGTPDFQGKTVGSLFDARIRIAKIVYSHSQSAANDIYVSPTPKPIFTQESTKNW